MVLILLSSISFWLLKNNLQNAKFLILVIGIFIYWACGFAFAYGKNVVKNENGDYAYSQANEFMGHNYFFLIDDDNAHVKVSRFLIEVLLEKS